MNKQSCFGRGSREEYFDVACNIFQRFYRGLEHEVAYRGPTCDFLLKKRLDVTWVKEVFDELAHADKYSNPSDDDLTDAYNLFLHSSEREKWKRSMKILLSDIILSSQNASEVAGKLDERLLEQESNMIHRIVMADAATARWKREMGRREGLWEEPQTPIIKSRPIRGSQIYRPSEEEIKAIWQGLEWKIVKWW